MTKFEPVNCSSYLQIWKKSCKFHLQRWGDIGILTPFLFVPFLSDSLHAIFIREDNLGKEHFHPLEALGEAVASLPKLIGIKMSFMVPAFLFGLIPFYGIWKDTQERLYWAMASNVIAFEKLSGKLARERCRQLVGFFSHGFIIRTLVTIPTLISVLFLIVFAVIMLALQSNFVFWIAVAFFWWLFVPVSAMVNTYVYLLIPFEQRSSSLKKFKDRDKTTYEEFCPRCTSYDSDGGICRTLSFRVREYPKKFPAECGGVYFTKMDILPVKMTCPYCRVILELDESERVQGSLVCPECERSTKKID